MSQLNDTKRRAISGAVQERSNVGSLGRLLQPAYGGSAKGLVHIVQLFLQFASNLESWC